MKTVMPFEEKQPWKSINLIAALICAYIILPISLVVCVSATQGCVDRHEKKMQQPIQESDSGFGRTGDRIFVSHRNENGKDLGGVSQRPGVSIHWAGSDRQDSSVRPRDVIAITIDRMEAEQQTDLGSDKNARAMVLLMQAIQVLEGTDQEIDGVPVIK